MIEWSCVRVGDVAQEFISSGVPTTKVGAPAFKLSPKRSRLSFTSNSVICLKHFNTEAEEIGVGEVDD